MLYEVITLLADVQELGFSDDERERFERWITSPNGLILVSGPTGSGKTTTLYSTLRYLAGPELNVTTVEDPIESLTGRPRAGARPAVVITSYSIHYTKLYERALRSILRQDPDVIMVGEIRDAETAQMAVQAALTGHLVFSTVHTRNAAGAVTRLLELGA